RNVESCRTWEPKISAADAIVPDGLVSGTKSETRRPGLRRQNAPHVRAIGLRAKNAAVGGDRQAGRIGRSGRGFIESPVTHRVVSENLGMVAGGISATGRLGRVIMRCNRIGAQSRCIVSHFVHPPVETAVASNPCEGWPRNVVPGRSGRKRRPT